MFSTHFHEQKRVLRAENCLELYLGKRKHFHGGYEIIMYM